MLLFLKKLLGVLVVACAVMLSLNANELPPINKCAEIIAQALLPNNADALKEQLLKQIPSGSQEASVDSMLYFIVINRVGLDSNSQFTDVLSMLFDRISNKELKEKINRVQQGMVSLAVQLMESTEKYATLATGAQRSTGRFRLSSQPKSESLQAEVKLKEQLSSAIKTVGNQVGSVFLLVNGVNENLSKSAGAPELFKEVITWFFTAPAWEYDLSRKRNFNENLYDLKVAYEKQDSEVSHDDFDPKAFATVCLLIQAGVYYNVCNQFAPFRKPTEWGLPDTRAAAVSVSPSDIGVVRLSSSPQSKQTLQIVDESTNGSHELICDEKQLSAPLDDQQKIDLIKGFIYVVYKSNKGWQYKDDVFIFEGCTNWEAWRQQFIAKMRSDDFKPCVEQIFFITPLCLFAQNSASINHYLTAKQNRAVLEEVYEGLGVSPKIFYLLDGVDKKLFTLGWNRENSRPAIAWLPAGTAALPSTLASICKSDISARKAVAGILSAQLPGYYSLDNSLEKCSVTLFNYAVANYKLLQEHFLCESGTSRVDGLLANSVVSEETKSILAGIQLAVMTELFTFDAQEDSVSIVEGGADHAEFTTVPQGGYLENQSEPQALVDFTINDHENSILAMLQEVQKDLNECEKQDAAGQIKVFKRCTNQLTVIADVLGTGASDERNIVTAIQSKLTELPAPAIAGSQKKFFDRTLTSLLIISGVLAGCAIAALTVPDVIVSMAQGIFTWAATKYAVWRYGAPAASAVVSAAVAGLQNAVAITTQTVVRVGYGAFAGSLGGGFMVGRKIRQQRDALFDQKWIATNWQAEKENLNKQVVRLLEDQGSKSLTAITVSQ